MKSSKSFSSLCRIEILSVPQYIKPTPPTHNHHRIRIRITMSNQQGNTRDLVTSEPVTMHQNFVSILGCDILSYIFEFLPGKTIKTLAAEAHNRGDIVSLRSIKDANGKWIRKRRAYHTKIEFILTDLHRSHLAMEAFTESTVVDNIFEYLSDDDISNLKQTDMLTHKFKKNPFHLQFNKLHNTLEHRKRKLDKYLNNVLARKKDCS
jgi:hypothetical protein